MFGLVREFLEYFNLDFTISVFDAESHEGSCYKYQGRNKILEEMGLDKSLSGPVLLQLLKIAQTKSKTLKINLAQVNENGSTTISSDVQCDNESVQLIERSSNPSNNIIKENCVTTNKKLDILPLNSTYTKKDVDNDDTFNGTSSIEEESVNGIEQHAPEENADQESSPDSSKEKSKSSQKTKSKLEISPRGSDILPSLYNNKDFKDKNKEFDFDIKDDYEEDFMSGSEVDCPIQLLQADARKKSPENSNSSTKTSDIQTNLSLDRDSSRSHLNS